MHFKTPKLVLLRNDQYTQSKKKKKVLQKNIHSRYEEPHGRALAECVCVCVGGEGMTP